MASTINLSRNTKVYFTTNVDATKGTVKETGSTSSNTFQIQVLDGYSFSQATTQSTIQISEAGNTPSRGQRAFNTALNPVEWSFSTYIRPSLGATTGPVSAAEKVLWNALLGENSIDTANIVVSSLIRTAVYAADGTTVVTAATASPLATIVTATALAKVSSGTTATTAVAKGDIININGLTEASFNQPAKVLTVSTNTYTVEFARAPALTAATTATVTNAIANTGQWGQGTTAAATSTTNYSYVSTMGANKNQLQKFGLIFVVDNVVYAIDNCAMDQVSVDFGLDAIATAAWSGKGTTLTKLTTLTKTTLENSSAVAPTLAAYITNKLSTMTLKSTIGGGGTSYIIPITGGNFTVANNINFQTPTNLAVVNVPIGYYTGQRAVSGNVTAYLRTGETTDSGGLLSTLLTAVTTTNGVEPKYYVQLEMGGSTASNRVEFEMPAAVLQIPAVNIADVVATTINFSGQGYSSDTSLQLFDVTANNELIVRYFSNTPTTAA